MPEDFRDLLGRTTVGLTRLEDVLPETTRRSRAQATLEDLRRNMARLADMHDELVRMKHAVYEATAEAAQMRARYFALLHFFDEPVLVVAGAGLQIQHANAAAATFLNLSLSSLPGRDLLRFFLADRPAIQTAVQTATTWPVRLTALIRPRERRAVSVALRIEPCDQAGCLFFHMSPAAKEPLPDDAEPTP